MCELTPHTTSKGLDSSGLCTRHRAARLARWLQSRGGVWLAAPSPVAQPVPLGHETLANTPVGTLACSAESFLQKPWGWQLLERAMGARAGAGPRPGPGFAHRPAVPPGCSVGRHTARRAGPARGYYPRGLQPLFRDLGRYNTCELK